MGTPLEINNVAVSGAGGKVAEFLITKALGGELFGKRVIRNLSLLEIPQGWEALQKFRLEIADHASPFVDHITYTQDPAEAFSQADYAILIGAVPRPKPDSTRGELYAVNGPGMIKQGLAIAENAKPEVKVMVVGNPDNSNARTIRLAAPKITADRITSMSMLDQNRFTAWLADQTNAAPRNVKNAIVWGNHSETLVADETYVTVNGIPIRNIRPTLDNLMGQQFTVNRGAEIKQVRGLTSNSSAAQAIIDHVTYWENGTKPNQMVSIGVESDGSYGVPEGIIFSFPCTSSDGTFQIVRDLELSPGVKLALVITADELLKEQEVIYQVLNDQFGG